MARVVPEADNFMMFLKLFTTPGILRYWNYDINWYNQIFVQTVLQVVKLSYLSSSIWLITVHLIKLEP